MPGCLCRWHLDLRAAPARGSFRAVDRATRGQARRPAGHRVRPYRRRCTAGLVPNCEMARAVHDPLNKTKTPGHRSPTSGRPAAKAGRKLSVSRACHISGSTPRILANVLGLKALVVPLKLNSSERRRMLVSGLKIRPVSVRVRLGAHETAAQRPSAPDGAALSPAAVRSASAVDSVTASKASAIRPRSSGNRCP